MSCAPRTSFSLVSIGLSAAAVSLATARVASAVQYPTQDPNYVQEIYTGPLVGGPGMAWTYSLNLLTRNGSQILEYSPTQNAVHQGTNIHGVITTHNITGLSNTGYGMTNAPDGYIYAATAFGLQRFDPNNWAAPAQSLAGTVGGQGYGINVIPDGRIVYSDGVFNSKVYLYDPVAATNTLIYDTATSAYGAYLIDDIDTGPNGEIALAGWSSQSIEIILPTGALISSFNTPHYPDGTAFGAGPYANSLYANNNDGTVTRYDWAGPGWTGAPASFTDIMSGAGSYGDLAAVGPDCAFYVTNFDNGGLHGSTPGVGTNWDNSVTNAEPSITRIALANLSGGTDADCGFFSPVETFLPEPGCLGLFAWTATVFLKRRRS